MWLRNVILFSVVIILIFAMATWNSGWKIWSPSNRWEQQLRNRSTSKVSSPSKSSCPLPLLKWNADLGIFTTSDGKPLLFIYWEDFSNLPLWLKLTMASTYCHNRRSLHIVLLNKTTINSVFDKDSLPEAIPYLSSNHRADYFRVRLLHQFGGMWLDSDFVGLSKLLPTYEKLRVFDWFNERDSDYQIVAVASLGPMRAGLAASAQWISEMHSMFTAHRKELKYKAGKNYWSQVSYDGLEWNAIASPMASRAVRRSSIRYGSELITNYFGQIHSWSNWSDPTAVRKLKPVPTVHLYHHLVEKIMDDKSFEQIVNYNTTDNYFIREIIRLGHWLCKNSDIFLLANTSGVIQLGGVDAANKPWNRPGIATLMRRNLADFENALLS